LGVRVNIEHDQTSLADLEGHLDSTLEVMHRLGYSPDESKGLESFQAALAAGVAPREKAVALGLGDRRFAHTAIELEGFIGKRGLEQIFTAPNGRLRTPPQFERAYLDAAGLSGASSLLSKHGLAQAIERTLNASLTPISGGWAVGRDGQRLGTLSDADVETLRQAALDARPANGGARGWKVSAPASVGQWNERPEVLLSLEPSDWAGESDVLRGARRFSSALVQAGLTRAQNSKPGTALYEHPNAYFAQLNALFQGVVEKDGAHSTAALAMLHLAGRDGIATQAKVHLPPPVAVQMIDIGRDNVRRFAAASLLAGMAPRFNAEGALCLSATDVALTKTAAKALFGWSVPVSVVGSEIVVPDTAISDVQRETLSALFAAPRGQDGSLEVPKQWNATHTRHALNAVFGRAATVVGDRVVFDRTGYDFINISDALIIFGPQAFAAHRWGVAPKDFPTNVPIDEQPGAQEWDVLKTHTVATHVGERSTRPDDFDPMALMHGPNADLADPQMKEGGWVLTGN
jgi:hypothetical protein